MPKKKLNSQIGIGPPPNLVRFGTFSHSNVQKCIKMYQNVSKRICILGDFRRLVREMGYVLVQLGTFIYK